MLLFWLAACAGDKPSPDDTSPRDTSADTADTADSDDTADTTDSTDSDSGETAETGDTGCEEAPTWHRDADGDGHGDPGKTTQACEAPEGWVAAGDDCDDADPGRYPAAPELCDGAANACEDHDWQPADEDGTVSWYPPVGVPTSATAEWAAGRDGAPAAVSLGAGTWRVCPGTFYVSAVATGDVTLEGAGVGVSVLSGGGAARTLEAQGNLELAGLTLENGYVDGSGGNLLLHGDLDARDVLVRTGAARLGGGIAGESAGDLALRGVEIRENVVSESGGGLYLSGASNLVAEDVSFALNEAYAGGAVRGEAVGDLSLTDVTVEDNHAAGAGGIYWESVDASAGTLERVTLLRNSATGTCGAACVYINDGARGTLDLSEVVVEGNTAGTGQAGGLWASDTLTVRALTLTDNVTTSGDAGGGYYSGVDLTLLDVTATGNRSAGDGGGLTLYYDDTLTLTGATLRGNTASTGGGLYVFGYGATSFTIQGLDVSENVATYGAGLALDAANGTLSDSLLSANDSGYYGGGAFVSGCDRVTFQDGVRIEENTAEYGGGVYVQYSVLRLEGDGTVLDGMRRNEARIGGGAFLQLYRGDTLTAAAYDFGTGEDDNVAKYGMDVYNDGSFDDFGDPATFTCGYDAGCE